MEASKLLEEFYEKRILSFDDYERLRERFSGFTRYLYATTFPERVVYPLIYQNQEFLQFVTLGTRIIWVIRILLFLSAIILVFSQ